jgi:hypothetical protein
MGCCGKINKVVSIAKGNLAVALDAINLLPSEKYLYHAVRLRACRVCQHHTYLTEDEYIAWIEANGGLAKFVAEIDTLEKWPPLPIEHNEQPGAKLFCSLCKCWLPAKSYVKNENCPVHNPDWRKPKSLFKES